MRPPGLNRARRSACGGWASAAIGWALLAGATHGEDHAWAVAVTGMCTLIALAYWLWLLFGSRR